MLALTLGLAAALCWGLHDLLVRKTSAGPNVLGQILVICATGAPLLLVMSGTDLLRLTPGAAVMAAMAGASYLVAYFGLFRAFALAPARVISPMLGAYPLLSMLVATAAGAVVTPGDWLAVVAVVSGVAVVAALADTEKSQAASTAKALMWAALGAAGFAATFALGQAASVGGLSLAAGAVTRISGLTCILVLLALQRPSLAPVRQNWRRLIVMGVLDTAALGLVMRAGGLVHAEYASVAASLFGVVTIILSWVVLGEQVRRGQWLGIVLVFAGIGWLAV